MNVYEEFSKVQIQLERLRAQANQLIQRKNELAQEIIKIEKNGKRKNNKN